jgi:WD40 repeat protein
VAFGEGTTLFSGGFDKTVKLWNTETDECLATLTEHRRPVWSLAFDASKKRLASGDGNGLLVIWDVAQRTRHRAATLDDNPTNENSDKLPLSAIAYLPNGLSVACVLEYESIALLKIPQ